MSLWPIDNQMLINLKKKTAVFLVEKMQTLTRRLSLIWSILCFSHFISELFPTIVPFLHLDVFKQTCIVHWHIVLQHIGSPLQVTAQSKTPKLKAVFHPCAKKGEASKTECITMESGWSIFIWPLCYFPLYTLAEIQYSIMSYDLVHHAYKQMQSNQ